MNALKTTFRGESGIFDVCRMAMPLIMASAGHALNLFTDRMMLQWYGTNAMAAALPSGLTSFALSCFFVGTVGYATSFVAQYTGAKMDHRVGTAVWQSIHIAVIGALFMALCGVFAKPLFDLFGHEEALRPLEVIYFQILSFGGIAMLLQIALSNFWGGQGKTKVIMTVNLIVCAANFVFNYFLIFGKSFFGLFRFPELGIVGAAVGTVASGFVGVLLFALLFWNKENRTRYKTCSNIFDRQLFFQMIRYGAPNGIQLFLDLAAFNAFIILLGKLGAEVLAASAVAFSMNSLAFTPMIGVGQTVSILVGQAVGACNIPRAEKAVRSARVMVLLYMMLMMVIFVLWPDPVYDIFKLPTEGSIRTITKYMLRFIAGYLLFDGVNIVYGSAVKGAGDTKFVMWACALNAWLLYAIPCFLCYLLFASDWMIARIGAASAHNWCLWLLWGICVFYIMIQGIVMYIRYRGGKWKKMKVIESEANDHPRGAIPKEPGVDVFLP